MTEAPEPEDKLDAATKVVVNGPEDATFDWRQVDWRTVEADVRRLRQRIFTASKAGDLKKVRSLQKLMLRSRANTLVSVRRVTERNAGRLTAGVDGEVVLTPEAKAKLAGRVQQNAEPFKALPVRRVYIPKPGSRKRRPLGIPVILDRCHQARVVNALEPEWEARFEPRSYGFRPGRGCHDAIQAIYEVVKGRRPQRLWALDADLAGAFERIAHDHILTMLGTFPARGMIRQWLKAGVVEQGRLHRTEEGTPQGGVVSPVLLNVALHGMEKVAGARYTTGKYAGRIMSGCPVVIRYADDFVVLCHTRQEALEVKARLAGWLAPRGLAFNEDKTRVVTLDEGFDFLGFNVRRYGGKPLIKPSKAAQRRIRERLRTELRSLRGTNAQAVIKRLNPIIRGWAAYYRTQVSAEVFGALDHYLWTLTYKWARISHQNKPKSWVVHRYFGPFNKSRQDRWVFGDRHSAAYMHKFSWTRILRHRIVRHGASPDDPALADYWGWRRRKVPLPINKTIQELTDAQDGRCSICGGFLFAVEDRPQNPREWEQWLATTRTTINTIAMSKEAEPRLVHATCRHGHGLALHNAYEPSGLA
ncbi:MAG TPA: group II intron reverse transcriptase/maturase [Arthrobacter sp.]|jgi:RNA-directed DNA polymerase|nr:group II intron reverse transcriptase/maturase [Arthrobacter sp.]